MPSVFRTGDAPCGVFAPQGGALALEFFSHTLVSVTSAGDTFFSFTSIGVVAVEVQPVAKDLVRQVGNLTVQADFWGVAPGYAAVRERNRCTIDGRQVEVTQVAHYGTEQTEFAFTHVAR